MSKERIIRELLNPTGIAISTDSLQQITPDMRFTCDGVITKWIIGAEWSVNGDYNPELQLWRSYETGVYHKISGTYFRSNTPIPLGVYEYSDFSPIPFKAGDVLGVFIPEDQESRIRLRSENRPSPINYYIPTGSATESLYNNIDILNMQQVSSVTYHPLVTVEAIRCKYYHLCKSHRLTTCCMF